MAFGLVLGGGGTVGVAWTLGLLAGLARAGADPSASSVIVGTSAGAIVGSHVCAGTSLDALVERQRAPRPARTVPTWATSIDRDAFAEIFRLWTETDPMTPDVARAIATRAATATSLDPHVWIDATARLLPGTGWAGEALRITAVDPRSGERVVWTARDGVDLVAAVAASTAVPGIVPPIPIDGVGYVDGGVWSSTHADLMLGAGVDRVLLVAPQAGGGVLAPNARAGIERERMLLEAEGIAVTVVVPSEAFTALGPNLMDVRLRAPAAEIGLRDAETVAERVAAGGFARA